MAKRKRWIPILLGTGTLISVLGVGAATASLLPGAIDYDSMALS